LAATFAATTAHETAAPARDWHPNCEGLTDQEETGFPMAVTKSNARLRADAGAPTSGVIHVRTRLTADFTVLSNALAQRRGSAVTVGVAAYIASLPEGTLVTIAALCAHFSEGEILISRALRELEAAGYLERRRERLDGGRIRTRTYFYDVPGGGVPEPDGPPKPPRGRARREAAPATPVAPTPLPQLPPAQPPSPLPSPAVPPLAEADPRALDVLVRLRRVDPRLVLSEREAARLAPAVTAWLAAGVGPVRIIDILTTRLPHTFLGRPAGILAYRLRDTPLPAPPPLPHAEAVPPTPTVWPLQNCDNCDRAFRGPEKGCCTGCEKRLALRAAC
jgi:hypothetical protein